MGFSIRKMFPSRFLTGEELEGHEIVLVIKDVKKEIAHNPVTNKKGEVLVVYFQDKLRGIRLGKQRASELRDITGSDDTDLWKGKSVKIYAQKKEVGGKEIEVIHFKKP